MSFEMLNWEIIHGSHAVQSETDVVNVVEYIVVKIGNIGTDVPGSALRGTAADIMFGEVVPAVHRGVRVFVMNHNPSNEQIETLPANAVCVAGEPVFVYWLAHKADQAGLVPVVAVSDRKVIEKVLPNGGTEKVSVFVHAGWRAFFD